MIYVVKKSGKQQPFDPTKIQTSILNSAKDAGIELSFKEARMMSDDVERQLIALNGKDGLTSSFEVRSLVRAALREFGHTRAAEMFERGRSDDYSDIKRHLEAIQLHTEALDQIAQSDKLGKSITVDSVEDDERDKTQHYRSWDEDGLPKAP